MSGWRPALRIARRSVRRHLSRSVLIASLVAVPIAGATVMDGLMRTMTGAEHRVATVMGSADGIAEVSGWLSLPDWRPGTYPTPSPEDAERDPGEVDVAALLPEGSRVVPDTVGYSLQLTEGDRIIRTELDVLTVGDPLTDHRFRLTEGRVPKGPDEALVTESLAERLGLLDGGDLRPGATVTVRNGPTATVTGLAVHPNALTLDGVVAPPGTALIESASAQPYAAALPRYLVDLPAGADYDAVWSALAEHGVMFEPRDLYTNPDRYPGQQLISNHELMETAGPVALVVGFGVLEVVLLAGAAFAVGARRQVRDLGLIAANGGSARHVRRTVLAQGLFLGMLGALGGLALGVLVTLLADPLWEKLTGQLVDDWRFGWPELVLAGGVGLLSGLAAALLPAIGVARMRPVDALAQRFRSTAPRTRLPVLGVVLAGVGLAGIVVSGLLATRTNADYRVRLESAAGFVPSPDLTLPVTGLLLGALTAVVGVVLVTSGLLGALARVGGWLPLSGRLAVRDAGRHRHRTVPAIAAIMIVVAGSVALAFTFTAGAADETYSVPADTVLVESDSRLRTAGGEAADQARADLVAGSTRVAAELPGGAAVEIPLLRAGGQPVYLERSDGSTGRCGYAPGQVGVGSPRLLALATGHQPDAAMLAALDAGEIVTLDACFVGADGTAHTMSDVQGRAQVTLPAHRAHRAPDTSVYALPGAFVSARKAAALDWTPVVDTMAVTHSAGASQDQLDAAVVAAQNSGLSARIRDSDDDVADATNLGLAAGSGLVTLLGVGITVALSAAEGRADLATLAAIGAHPRRRRLLAGAHAFVLSGLGGVLGVLLGGVVGFAVVSIIGHGPFTVPWQHLGVTVAVVPLLAVAVAMLITRANLPMARRVD